MKKNVCMLLFLTAVLFASCGRNEVNPIVQTETVDVEEVVVEEEEQEKIKGGTIVEIVVPAPSLANNIIDETLEKEMHIYLPEDYETSGIAYPVLYFLPGFGDSYSSYMNTFAAALIKAQVNTMIVVSVNGSNRFGGSFYANSPVTGNWEDFVAQDLVSYMDENYRTLQQPQYRGIVGHSMGGFGAISMGMNTNVFGHVYAMSPGLLAPDSFQETSVHLDMIESRVDEYKDMSDDEAREDYMKWSLKMSWPKDFTFGYASAFAYDAEGKAPYISLPEKDSEGVYKKDEVWERYDNGFGNLSEKLIEKKEQISALESLIIEYGEQDEFIWIPQGCVYFSELLTEQGIDHQLDSYKGGHQEKVPSRIEEIVIPYFQNIWDS